MLLDHGDVGVLQSRPANLEVGDVFVLAQQLANRTRSAPCGMDELVAAVQRTCASGHHPASWSAFPSATTPPPGSIRIGQFLRLVQVGW